VGLPGVGLAWTLHLGGRDGPHKGRTRLQPMARLDQWTCVLPVPVVDVAAELPALRSGCAGSVWLAPWCAAHRPCGLDCSGAVWCRRWRLAKCLKNEGLAGLGGLGDGVVSAVRMLLPSLSSVYSVCLRRRFYDHDEQPQSL
jgi:hypothetical protein